MGEKTGRLDSSLPKPEETASLSHQRTEQLFNNQEMEAAKAPGVLSRRRDVYQPRRAIRYYRGTPRFNFQVTRESIPIPVGPSLLGASEVPSVLGLSPWSTRQEVWLRKTGRLVDERRDSEAFALGQALESTIRLLAENKLKRRFLRSTRAFVCRSLRLAAHPDAICQDGILEIKTSGLVGPIVGRWGSEPDAVPPWVAAQVQTQLALSKKKRAFVAALLGGIGLRIYELVLIPDFIEVLVDEVRSFWKSVDEDVAPDLAGVSAELLLANARRALQEIRDVKDPQLAQILDRYVELGQAVSAMTKEREALKSQILAAIGDAGGIYCEGFLAKVTESHSRSVDYDRLLELAPSVAAEVVTINKVRRLDVRRTSND
ncbi:MAG: YqaJ viral recombinase family protein [Anaerolineae bacterium]|nr:YqaJ viral recombinase family protein [Anaerolineae bacterium]